MWRYAQACVTGSSHLRSGLECQDCVGCSVLSDGTLVAAVSDGAGSAPMAKAGSAIAVSTAVGVLSAAIEAGTTDLVKSLLDTAKACAAAVRAAALENGRTPRDYAATLLLAAASRTSVAVLQIGDGVVVFKDPGKDWAWAFWPQKGEFINTTHFLTDEDAFESMQVGVFGENVQHLGLMTDGLETLALQFATQSVFGPFMEGLIRPLQQTDHLLEAKPLSDSLCGFLCSERVRSRVDDDCTILIATNGSPDTLSP